LAVSDDTTTPRGLTGRRRPRLSNEETERRMLQTAVDLVNRSGLTVSLEHISLEEVIRQAGVSRSAAYRRWPYKDLFFSDLLKQLATATTPAAVAQGPSIRLVKSVALAHLDWLETPQLRRQLVVELIRQGSVHDFQLIYQSTEWRTYLALHATFLSLADGRLREEVQAALAQAERGFTGRIAKGWEHLTGLLGYRLRPELNAGFQTLASLVTASVRGLVLMALSTPELATRRIQASPFGAAATAAWSLSAMGIASIADAFLEPDPTIEWDQERIATVRRLLESEDWSAFLRS
jgi:AcrR family transcriptional regulator